MTPTLRDPVCGMIIPPSGDVSVVYNNTSLYFCSEYCKDRFLREPGLYWGRYSWSAVQHEEAKRRIAYFSMEIAIAPAIPTYAGGLGVLAGDTLRSFADLQIPAVGVTLLYRKGYFRQSIDDSGFQREHAVEWDVTRVLRPLDEIVEVRIEGRPVKVRAWRYDIAGLSGYEIPVILLDTDMDGNTDPDRFLTHWLYGGEVLYDDAFPGWAEDPALLRKAVNIPHDAIWTAHTAAKRELLDFINERSAVSFSADALTIGFARRATQYKRADLVFSDLNRLVQIADRQGPVQFVFAGKAHPHDLPGKELIRRITALSHQLRERLKVVYLEDYDFDKARLITSGVDLWLNTPQRPLEASGTSGMKAALNGVPSLSTLDGWWLEGHIEGITGWSIGSRESGGSDDAAGDAVDLYRKLEEMILPMFHTSRDRWLEIMRHTIALNASYFTTHRMVQQYVTNAYL